MTPELIKSRAQHFAAAHVPEVRTVRSVKVTPTPGGVKLELCARGDSFPINSVLVLKAADALDFAAQIVAAAEGAGR